MLGPTAPAGAGPLVPEEVPLQTRDTLYIGGDFVAPATDATIEVISPATEEPVARVPEARVEDVARAVAAARQAFDEGPWPRMAPAERADAMGKLVGALDA
ncbi:MAG: aldehyde dehydrogenase family protein, partial [Myxococcota bacterium]|nr:aldehyde dehydrogenase family protein [Myxococcota bacterium]